MVNYANTGLKNCADPFEKEEKIDYIWNK